MILRKISFLIAFVCDGEIRHGRFLGCTTGNSVGKSVDIRSSLTLQVPHSSNGHHLGARILPVHFYPITHILPAMDRQVFSAAALANLHPVPAGCPQLGNDTGSLLSVQLW